MNVVMELVRGKSRCSALVLGSASPGNSPRNGEARASTRVPAAQPYQGNHGLVALKHFMQES
jgi:hypothetical protein